MDIGIIPGSFNPIHVGHKKVASYLWSTHMMDEVIFVPSFAHPYGKKLLPFEYRYNMCLMTADELNAERNTKRFRVSDVERRIGGTCNLTCDTVERLFTETGSQHRFFMAIGQDVFIDLPRWEGFDKLAHYVSFVAITRRTDGISSTLVRNRLRDGHPISDLVIESVECCLMSHAAEFIDHWG